MSERKRERKGRVFGRLNLDSKFWKTFLIILVAFLMFVGPTYIPYVLIKILKLDYFVSMISGFVLFAAGLTLMWYLIRSKIVS